MNDNTKIAAGFALGLAVIVADFHYRGLPFWVVPLTTGAMLVLLALAVLTCVALDALMGR